MLNQLRAELLSYRDDKRAKNLSWFFKTDKGEYGEGDIFYGLTVPTQRELAKKYANLSLAEARKLIRSKIHEERLTCLLILIKKYESDSASKPEIVRFYLKNKKYINNWDLVDFSAGRILGDYLMDRDRNVLTKLAKSKSLWDRRIAIMATSAFLRRNQFKDTLKIAEILLYDKHDFIHKAVGWMLREIGKRNLAVEERILDKYGAGMPRTMLRYAIEKFSEDKRKDYLKKRNKCLNLVS